MKIVKPLLLLVALATLSSCDKDEKDNAPAFALRQIDITNVAGFFSTVNGSYHENEKRYLMETLYQIDNNMNVSAAGLVFEGMPSEEIHHYSVYDISDEYFMVSFFTLKQNFFVSKTDGTATEGAYFEPNFFFKRFATDSRSTLYYVAGTGGVQKIADFLSVDAVPEFVAGFSDVQRMFTDKDNNLIIITGQGVHMYDGSTVKKLLEPHDGAWKGADGIARTITPATGEIMKIMNGTLVMENAMPAPIGFIHGAFNFSTPAKTVGVELNKGKDFSIYELHPSQGLKVKIPENSLPSQTIYYAETQAGDDLYILYGVRDATKTLAKIKVTDYTVETSSVNTVHSIDRLYALGNGQLLAGVCVPNAPSEGCLVQVGYITAGGEMKFFYDTNMWFGEVIPM